jgi:hypothetical protein
MSPVRGTGLPILSITELCGQVYINSWEVPRIQQELALCSAGDDSWGSLGSFSLILENLWWTFSSSWGAFWREFNYSSKCDRNWPTDLLEKFLGEPQIHLLCCLRNLVRGISCYKFTYFYKCIYEYIYISSSLGATTSGKFLPSQGILSIWDGFWCSPSNWQFSFLLCHSLHHPPTYF